MSRAVITIYGPPSRARAHNWVERAPRGTRVEFREEQRTLPQNDMMWALLTEFARQRTLRAKHYPADIWKSVLLHAFGREMQFVPTLDEDDFIPIPMSSSELTASEMSAFIEFIRAEGTKRGVVFQDETP